ncbi:hypothetical protein BDU57DRAFT_525542 [Ampelomyces quisqualis]|uniref:Survival protein SurE-like phosphatase/nucleotidase domain-containing protein n=1 Tax=Ampelomyces quisqualis TaxID=50730 RepID=A0A6A5QYI9_AMPQU|nr:hypothetical protein BDU57DRAFT_525542 [Ampelomyces quisqualis]
MVKFHLLHIVALPLTQAIRLFLTNDEGWDDSNIRTLYNDLSATTSHELILCAPEIESSQTRRPFPMFNTGDEELSEDEWSDRDDDSSSSGDEGSVFDKDEKSHENDWSPLNNKARVDLHREHWPYGFNVSDFHLNYAPFPPYITVGEGLELLPPWLYRERDGEEEVYPDLLVVGPKIGSSLGNDWRYDRAIIAVQMAAEEISRPSIFFAGATGVRVTFRSDDQQLWSKIYAELAKKIISTIAQGGAPYLPEHTHLHVNFPHVTEERCNDASQFKFILTSHSDVPDSDVPDNRPIPDPRSCKEQSFPYEQDVVKRLDGCYVSMSLVTMEIPSFQRLGPSETAKQEIIRRLDPIVSCLPDM